jgi:hypothetical protein
MLENSVNNQAHGPCDRLYMSVFLSRVFDSEWESRSRTRLMINAQYRKKHHIRRWLGAKFRLRFSVSAQIAANHRLSLANRVPVHLCSDRLDHSSNPHTTHPFARSVLRHPDDRNLLNDVRNSLTSPLSAVRDQRHPRPADRCRHHSRIRVGGLFVRYWARRAVASECLRSSSRRTAFDHSPLPPGEAVQTGINFECRFATQSFCGRRRRIVFRCLPMHVRPAASELCIHAEEKDEFRSFVCCGQMVLVLLGIGDLLGR